MCDTVQFHHTVLYCAVARNEILTFIQQKLTTPKTNPTHPTHNHTKTKTKIRLTHLIYLLLFGDDFLRLPDDADGERLLLPPLIGDAERFFLLLASRIAEDVTR